MVISIVERRFLVLPLNGNMNFIYMTRSAFGNYALVLRSCNFIVFRHSVFGAIWCYFTNCDSILTERFVYTIHNLISIIDDTKRTIPGNVQNDSFVCMFALRRTANTERERVSKKESTLLTRHQIAFVCQCRKCL